MKKVKTPTVETQVEEFNYQLAISKRIEELKQGLTNLKNNLEQYRILIERDTANANATAGAISELEQILKDSNLKETQKINEPEELKVQ